MKHLQKVHKTFGLPLLGLILLLVCTAYMKKETEYRQKKPESILYGSWILQNKDAINYPQIIFNEDYTAIFKSRGDTIYRFTYLLKGANLTLQSITGEEETYEIVKLNNDSLVFNGLRENLEQQIYIRE